MLVDGVEAQDADPTGRGAAVALEGLDGRGLAGSVGPEQGEDLAGGHAEIQAVDGGELPVADDEALTKALDRVERRETLSLECKALQRDLQEAGDGHDEAHLRAEQAGLDPEALPAQIELAEAERKRLLQDIGEAAAAASAAQARRDALAQGRDALSAANAREEAKGDLIDLAERWLTRMAAAKLASRVIERHREAAQDPLIARAGALFALATAHAFKGLGVGYNEADQPLLEARRASGEAVRIEGLSEGARDQLFLCLRLALLERRAGAPLPFIGDDLLASFDDERAARALTLLAEFGAKRQTILFTHHARLAQLAQGLSGIEVIEMEGPL